MLLIGLCKKTLVVLCNIRRITFLDVPILFVDNGIVRQGLDSLMPCRVYGIVPPVMETCFPTLWLLQYFS